MANQKPWSFTQNPFLNASTGSYRLAVRISDYHSGALSSQQGNDFFDGLIASYNPLNNALKEAFSNWKSQGGTQQGQTLQVTQLLKLLSSTKIKKWDLSIQIVYDNTSPQYKALLPHNRTPFQSGSQEDRVAAVASLITAIGNDGDLQLVKTDASNFLEGLQEAITKQKSDLATTRTISDAVEAARVAACTGMYGNLGALMQHYSTSTDSIENYFDLSVIRSGAQVVFTGDTKPLENENILKHTFHTGDKLLLRNEGVTELQFFLASQKHEEPDGAFSVAAGQQVTVLAESLGSLNNSYLNVKNPDTINKGEWTVDFV